ncbi:MAG: lipoate--protein ligase family protein, partial [Planctomycetota bacterium]
MIQIAPKLDSAALRLAMDEACLLAAEEGELGPSLRVWSFADPVVVLGRSSKVDEEVNREFCREHDITILRRCSGGASIVGGPGCLMYSVVLSNADHPSVAKIDGAHELVMARILAAVRRQLPDAELNGICDLTLAGRKFSGNALRVTRTHVLYHGTMLMTADTDLVAGSLAFAPRQPDYRAGRGHGDFITNVKLNVAQLTRDLAGGFEADPGVPPESVIERAVRLAATRYSRD